MDLFQLLQAAGTIYGASQAGRSAERAADVTGQATERAAQLQRESAREALDLQRQMYQESVARQEPWMQAGRNALTQLTAASQYTPFGMQQFQADPGYAFRMQEGMRALERGAAARGGLLSGNTLRATQRYGQDLASQEYQNAFNRYQAERQARLGPLQSLAGVGQTTAQALGGAGQQYGSQAGQMITGLGANLANLGMSQAGTAANAMMARGSAYQRGLGDLAYMTGRYYGGGGGGGGGGYQAPAPIEARTSPYSEDYGMYSGF